MSRFKTFLESFSSDPFKFDRKVLPPYVDSGEMPIKAFSLEKFKSFLLKNTVNGKTAQDNLKGITWGEIDGAVRVKINPNLNLALETKITCFNGEEAWLTKKLFKIKQSEYAGREDLVADDVVEELKLIGGSGVEQTARNFNPLRNLVAKITRSADNYMKNFKVGGTKQHSDFEYHVELNPMGQGQGQIVHRPDSAGINSAVLTFALNPDNGIIKIIFNTISSNSNSGAWLQDVPYFVGHYSNKQNPSEIVQTVLNGLRFI